MIIIIIQGCYDSTRVYMLKFTTKNGKSYGPYGSLGSCAGKTLITTRCPLAYISGYSSNNVGVLTFNTV